MSAGIERPSTRGDLATRLAGGVWGHLVGDAVGVPYEFKPARPAERVLFGAKGTWGQPPGTWSDDGALMLALLDSLLETGFDTTDQARRAQEWYRRKAYTPDGDGRFDIGTTTRDALRAFGGGTPAEDAGPTHEQANGNGSLMRILPLALVEREIPDAQLVTLAHRASRVTHGTARAQAACALYSILVRRLVDGSDGRAAALADARRSLRDTYERANAAEHLAALDHLEAHTERAGRSRVWDSFWSAWDAFAGAADYRDTIQRAVAYGHDTDTTAAIAGGLAGIRWGIGGIPWEWLAGMRGREVVEPLVHRLVAGTDTNPIRVDWVDLREVPGLATLPGRLGMTFLPGRDEGLGGQHHRDLVDDVRWLREGLAVDAFLLLVEDHELELLRIPTIADVMATHGIDLMRLPIRDTDVPADPVALSQTLDGVRARLATGESVVVACRGGLGRTGTVVGCLLRDGGLDGNAAIELTRASRPKTLENPEQERFVHSWGDR
jgi:ADP-ribosylglycohydrolase